MQNKVSSFPGGLKNFMAHRREEDGSELSLWTHLEETSFFY